MATPEGPTPDPVSRLNQNPGNKEASLGNIINIPRIDWIRALPEAIKMAKDGDTIIIHSQAMKELAERALARMRPGDKINFVIESGKQ